MNNNLTTSNISYDRLSPEERDERKDNRTMLIGEKAQHAMEFEARVSRHLRSLGERSHHVCAEVLREILFWEMSNHVIRRDFWMYRVYKCDGGCDPDSRGHCCWDAGGFSRSNMDTARRVLAKKYGLLEERRWYGGKIYYRVNHRALFAFLAKMEGTPEVTTGVREQDEHSGVYETSIPDCRFLTVPKQRESTENNLICLTDSTPVDRGPNFKIQELHDGQHDRSTSTTSPREPKPLSVGERIARQVHRRLKQMYGNPRQTGSLWPSSGLTDVEFSALVGDVNYLHDELYGPTGKRERPVTFEEISDAADWLVDCYRYSEDGRAYPPRADDPLIHVAFQATKFGNPPRKL